MRGNKNKKKLIIAIAVGMIPAIGVFNMVNNQSAQIEQLKQQASQQPVAAPVAPTDPIVLTVQAKDDIKAGEVITMAKLEMKEYKKSELPINSFNLASYVVGKIAGQKIFKGKIITEDDFLDIDPNLINIPPGMRAITIPTSSIQGLASYIFVGSKIDIISVKSPPQFIAQNVKIISMETSADNSAPMPAPTPAPAPNTTPSFSNNASNAAQPVMQTPTKSKNNISADKALAITILIPTSSANRLVDSMISGKIQIILRGAGDNKITRNSYSSSSSSISTSSKLNLPPPPTISTKLPSLPSSPIDVPQQDNTPKTRVEIITASNKTQACFDDAGNPISATDCSRPKASSSAPSSSSSTSLPSAPPSKSLNDSFKNDKVRNNHE